MAGEDASPSEVEGPGFNQPGPLLEEVKSDEEEPHGAAIVMLAEPWLLRIPPPKQRHTLIIELDDGKIYRKPLYLMVKTMVSCRFSLKPIH